MDTSRIIKAVQGASPETKEMLEFLVDECAKAQAVAKAASALADRYRKERDGARADHAALKTKIAEGALLKNDVASALEDLVGSMPGAQDEIAKALLRLRSGEGDMHVADVTAGFAASMFARNADEIAKGAKASETYKPTALGRTIQSARKEQ